LKKLWAGALAIGVLGLLSLGAAPAGADGMDKHAPPRGSDARQLLEEWRSGGAVKFYEDTEDILRAGKFERAYVRYLFLRAHLVGLDAAITPMVNQRLQFLREQMHLGEGAQYSAREERPVRRRPAKPACPPAPPKETKPKPPGEEEPPEIVIPPATPDNKAAEPPKEEAKPPGQEDPKPAPAPSAWDKIKRRLKFW